MNGAHESTSIDERCVATTLSVRR